MWRLHRIAYCNVGRIGGIVARQIVIRLHVMFLPSFSMFGEEIFFWKWKVIIISLDIVLVVGSKNACANSQHGMVTV